MTTSFKRFINSDGVQISVELSGGLIRFFRDVQGYSESLLSDFVDNLAVILDESAILYEMRRGQRIVVINNTEFNYFCVMKVDCEGSLIVEKIYDDGTPRRPLNGDLVLVHRIDGNEIIASYHH